MPEPLPRWRRFPWHRAIMASMAIRITEAEFANNPRAVLDRVQAGVEVVVEDNHRPIAVIRAPRRSGRRISEVLAESSSRPSTVTLDPEFADDLRAVIAHHRTSWTPPSWE
jgi:antitoxin (DNA-binding transcriptional repressor) of toxin-antitoxin stability system